MARLQARLFCLAFLLLALSSCTCSSRRLVQDPVQQPAPKVQAPQPATEGPAAPGGGNTTAATGSGEIFQGDGTAFSEKVDNTGKGFACSFRYLNDWASTYFAAINAPQWANGDNCGRCATVRCIDERCRVRDKDVTVMLVDACPECKHGDLDISIPAYREITGSWPNRLRVQWQFSDCSPFIDGNIKLAPKDGGNAQWQAFYFSNAKYPLDSVMLNGAPLKRDQYQFWQHSGTIDGTATFEFKAENGQTVKATSEDPFKEQDLGVQFPSHAG